MESFFHTLKTELVDHRDYATRVQARTDIFAFIEGFYNRTKLPAADLHDDPLHEPARGLRGRHDLLLKFIGRFLLPRSL
jgi:transposase InsO family protein